MVAQRFAEYSGLLRSYLAEREMRLVIDSTGGLKSLFSMECYTTCRVGRSTSAKLELGSESALQALTQSTRNPELSRLWPAFSFGRAGLEYAIMSGGDVAPLEEQAVTELHKLFRPAEPRCFRDLGFRV